MKPTLLAAALLAALGTASAKLPPPDDAAKAKAAETAAKAAWQGKVDAYQLCKAQDRVVAAYRKTAGSKPAAAASAATVKTAMPAAAAPAPAPTAKAMPPAAAAPAIAGTSAPAGTPVVGTPVAAATPTPCSDPGPFAYNPPEQKPLETSGAHSPAGTAASPPSVRAESAQMAPATKK